MTRRKQPFSRGLIAIMTIVALPMSHGLAFEWETAAPEVSATPVNTTIHDFRGFPRQLYELRYEMDNRPDWVAVPLAGIVALAAT